MELVVLFDSIVKAMTNRSPTTGTYNFESSHFLALIIEVESANDFFDAFNPFNY